MLFFPLSLKAPIGWARMRFIAFTPSGLFLLCIVKYVTHTLINTDTAHLCLYIIGWNNVAYHGAGALLNVTNRVLIRAATVMVITADCIFKRATSPSKTEVPYCENTAASGASRALVVFITHSGGLNRRRRRWRGRRRVGRIPTFLDRVRWLNGNATQPGFRVHITVHSHVALFSPVWTPWVLDNPVVQAVFCAVSDNSHAVVQIGATRSSEYSLEIKYTNIIYVLRTYINWEKIE